MGSGVSAEAAGSLDFGWASTPLAPFGDSALTDLGAVDASDSVAVVCAPPLLLIVTPGATWVLDDVAPDVFEVSVTVVPLPVEVDPLVDAESPPVVAVDEAPVPVVDVAADPVDDSPVVVLAELVDDDSEDVPVVSAAATPKPVATAATSHAATAMPPYPPSFVALRAALRDGDMAAGALDEGETNKGLTGGWLPVMGSHTSRS